MALHPGNVYTDLKDTRFVGPLTPCFGMMLNFFGMFIPVDKGVHTGVFCATSEEVKSGMPGEYFVPLGKVGKSSKNARDMVITEKLWSWMEEVFRVKKLLRKKRGPILRSFEFGFGVDGLNTIQ